MGSNEAGIHRTKYGSYPYSITRFCKDSGSNGECIEWYNWLTRAAKHLADYLLINEFFGVRGIALQIGGAEDRRVASGYLVHIEHEPLDDDGQQDDD